MRFPFYIIVVLLLNFRTGFCQDSSLARLSLEGYAGEFGVSAAEDLNLSPKDIEDFKSFIDKEAQKVKKGGLDENDFARQYHFPGKNTDFGYYNKVADSLSSLSSDAVSDVFIQPDSYWSTTTDMRRIVFVFKDGKKLIVENSYNRPNYLFMPWDVNYEGLRSKSNSLKFSQIVNDLTHGAFYDPVVRDKNYAIFRIADFLYQQKIIESH